MYSLFGRWGGGGGGCQYYRTIANYTKAAVFNEKLVPPPQLYKFPQHYILHVISLGIQKDNHNICYLFLQLKSKW